jgi:hypothetical protein
MAATVSKPTSRAKAEVDVQSAVQAAFNYFHRAFGSDPTGRVLNQRISDVSLEEVEQSEDGKHWLITLGYSEARSKNLKLPEFLQVPLRKLKVFTVDATTGQVKGMKIRVDG